MDAFRQVSPALAMASSFSRIGQLVRRCSKPFKTVPSELEGITNDLYAISALMSYYDDVTTDVYSERINLAKLQKDIDVRVLCCQQELEEYFDEISTLCERSAMSTFSRWKLLWYWFWHKSEVASLRASIDSITKVVNLVLITLLLHSICQEVAYNPREARSYSSKIEILEKSLQEAFIAFQRSEEKGGRLNNRDGIADNHLTHTLLRTAQAELREASLQKTRMRQSCLGLQRESIYSMNSLPDLDIGSRQSRGLSYVTVDISDTNSAASTELSDLSSLRRISTNYTPLKTHDHQSNLHVASILDEQRCYNDEDDYAEYPRPLRLSQQFSESSSSIRTPSPPPFTPPIFIHQEPSEQEGFIKYPPPPPIPDHLPTPEIPRKSSKRLVKKMRR